MFVIKNGTFSWTSLRSFLTKRYQFGKKKIRKKAVERLILIFMTVIESTKSPVFEPWKYLICDCFTSKLKRC